MVSAAGYLEEVWMLMLWALCVGVRESMAVRGVMGAVVSYY